MILLILIIIPLLCGSLLILLPSLIPSKAGALVSTLLSLAATLILLTGAPGEIYNGVLWFQGAAFTLGADAISRVMLLLTGLLFPFIILTGFGRHAERAHAFYALILFTQAALSGVFLAQNAFLFYVFWELALIPVYFILLLRGGEGRWHITLKFFIYTLAGSLFLLFGIIYLYQLTPGMHSADFSAFSQLQIPEHTQIWLFWILFIAFAIKMPLFPFHTWQPSTYTMAPTQGVMILAGLMTKMGIYGVLRFIFPVVPLGAAFWQQTVIILGITGMVYASVIAFRQDNLKRLIAFSSLAHISLMAAAMFAMNAYALQGVLFQVISHGVSVIALFYLVMLMADRTGDSGLNRMGGFKLQAPAMALIFLIISLGLVALPLTSGFVGEFLMITGLFHVSAAYAVAGGLTLITGAVYMFYAYQRVMLGPENTTFTGFTDLSSKDYLILIPLAALILILGVYPQPLLDLASGTNLFPTFFQQANETLPGILR
jgi:NADH-quinone oxidoreductase subunit M